MYIFELIFKELFSESVIKWICWGLIASFSGIVNVISRKYLWLVRCDEIISRSLLYASYRFLRNQQNIREDSCIEISRVDAKMARLTYAKFAVFLVSALVVQLHCRPNNHNHAFTGVRLWLRCDIESIVNSLRGQGYHSLQWKHQMRLRIYVRRKQVRRSKMVHMVRLWMGAICFYNLRPNYKWTLLQHW